MDHVLFSSAEDLKNNASDSAKALKTIMYEDSTPLELADGFKDSGNNSFKIALVLTKGIAHFQKFGAKPLPKNISPNAEFGRTVVRSTETNEYNVYLQSQSDVDTATKNIPIYLNQAHSWYTKAIKVEYVDEKNRSIYFSNRAAVEMKLSRPSRAIKDCIQSIELDPNNLKAYIRAVGASETLKKYIQALSFASSGLRVASFNSTIENSEKQNLSSKNEPKGKMVEKFGKMVEKLTPLAEKEQTRLKELTRQQQRKTDLKTRENQQISRYFKTNKITFAKPIFEPFPYQSSVRWEMKSQTLYTSVLLIFEHYAQTEFIPSCPEYARLSEIATSVLGQEPPAWDTSQIYKIKDLAFFVPVRNSPNDPNDCRFKQISSFYRLTQLFKVLGYIVPCCVTLYVLPTKSPLFKPFINSKSPVLYPADPPI